MTKKALCWTAAGILLAWQAAAVTLWFRACGSLGECVRRSWAAATGDWMVLLFLTDMAVFVALCTLWMAVDARRRGRRWGLWVVAVLLLGSPALLAYLALSQDERTGDQTP